MTVLVPLLVLLPLLGAAVALGLVRHRGVQRVVTVSVLALVVVIAAVLLVVVDRDGTLVMQVGGWAAPYGISLVVDRLSALLLLVSAAVLLAVLLYSVGQGLADDDADAPVTIYYPTYLVLAAGVLNSFIAGDLFNLYVGFEMLLVASFVLITVGGSATRVRAGTTYIITSLVSSAIFLTAIGLVYGATGTVNLAQISQRVAELPLGTQLLLHSMLLIGFGIKAAVFPLAFWLPDSYPTAPAPVTAVFAGLLTKVGVYAIIRLETVVFPSDTLNPVLMVVAALTMFVGVLGAVSQTDVKRLLSFTLVSHIGYMIMGIGLGTVAGTAAAVFYTVHHILVQTTLFLASGLIERTGGSTSTRRLAGLLKASPLLGFLYFIPALNLGGIPPFSGFIGKVALFRAAAEQGGVLASVLIGVGSLTSLLTLYALMRVWDAAFWRPRRSALPSAPHADLVPDTAAFAAERGGADSGRASSPESVGDVGATSVATATAATTTASEGLAAPEHVRLPRMLVGVTVTMVGATLALTVFAGPLMGYATRAAEGLESPVAYVTAVLGTDGGAR
ncbi:Na+/H+ antiporter subunit D [Curtobacterium sp. RRHDQ10]|uniref:Na+/H+ antiporter subunit D n=1 Tax=Curtobacterium phyllosphaerae TaxID=3413379 RepID=UPI003BF3F75E